MARKWIFSQSWPCNNKYLHFYELRQLKDKIKMHIAPYSFFEGTRGHVHSNKTKIGCHKKKPMLKYLGSHKGKTQSTPKKVCIAPFAHTFCNLQSTIYKQLCNPQSKHILKVILKAHNQESKLYSKPYSKPHIECLNHAS